jgi:RimJ/RimL family protein N-acetyltransferase
MPVIDAGDHRLRGFTESEPDLDLVRRASRDPVIPSISTVPTPYTEAEGRRYLTRQTRSLRDGFGYSFVIATAADHRPVGSVGVWLRDIDLGRVQLGYWVVDDHRRRGAARQAVTAAGRWALSTLPVARLEIHVEAWNVASIRTAESAGFVLEGLLRSWEDVGGERRDMLSYSLIASDLAQGSTRAPEST